MDKKVTPNPQTTKIEDVIMPNKITVDHNGQVFVFRIPSAYDELEIDALMAEILRTITKSYMPRFVLGVRGTALLRAEATLRVLLEKAPEWVYSKDENGAPIIDAKKWNPKQVDILLEVVDKFYEEKERFQ